MPVTQLATSSKAVIPHPVLGAPARQQASREGRLSDTVVLALLERGVERRVPFVQRHGSGPAQAPGPAGTVLHGSLLAAPGLTAAGRDAVLGHLATGAGLRDRPAGCGWASYLRGLLQRLEGATQADGLP